MNSAQQLEDAENKAKDLDKLTYRTAKSFLQNFFPKDQFGRKTSAYNAALSALYQSTGGNRWIKRSDFNGLVKEVCRNHNLDIVDQLIPSSEKGYKIYQEPDREPINKLAASMFFGAESYRSYDGRKL